MSKRSRTSRIPVPESVERRLDAVLDKALSVQRPAVRAYLARVRRRRPDATPAEIVEMLEHRYLAAVVGTGAASGGTSALPGVGTAASIATGAAEITAFVSASAMFVLALAELHDIPTADPQLRRAMVLTVLLGEVGEVALAGGEVDVKHWARVLGHSRGKDNVQGVNARLARLFVTRFGAKQGALIAGRALPFGIGAGIGAAGNAALGRGVIRSARKAFGPAPARFPGRVVDADAGDTPRRDIDIKRK
ncbi:MAG: hypothetical protein ACRDVG_11810 [Jatrophihabitantaceae bacterium]